MTTAQKSEVMQISKMVDYKKGSVASRQVTSADAGTVTLFAFDTGKGLAEHTAPFDALVHVLEGEAELILSGQLYKLKAGDAIIMPANSVHELKAVKKFKMLLTMIRK